MTRGWCRRVAAGAGRRGGGCGGGRARRPAAAPRRRRPRAADRLVVGYDREPDTLNRFSTHILEDIETCVVEGLVTTDEKMTIVPLLAASIPTRGERRRRPAQGRRHGRHLEAAAEHHLARRHAAHLRRREVHGRGDQQPGLQPREHRRLRPHHQRRHARPAHRRAALQGGLRPLPAAVHARHAAQARARGPRHRHRQRLQPGAARHRALQGGGVEERRVHPPRGRAQLLAGQRPAARQDAALQVHRQHQYPHQPAEERGSGHGGDVPVGQAPRGGGDSRRAASIAPTATATSTSR